MMKLCLQIWLALALVGASGLQAKKERYRVITVEKGDTLSKIAKKYLENAKDYRELLKYNKIKNVNKIYPGMKLKVPDYLQKKPVARVSFKVGQVSYKTKSELKWSNAYLNLGLFTTDSFKTGKRGKARLRVGNAVVVNVKPKTFLRISSKLKKQAGSQLFLSSGSIFASITKGEVGAGGFRVRTPSAVAAVRGTKFLANVGEGEATTLGCYNGEVAVSAGGKTVSVGAGQATTVEKGGVPAEPFELPPPPQPSAE